LQSKVRPSWAYPRDVAALIVALLDDPLTIASAANIPLFSNA
jgi:hypothetical protein